MPTLFPVRNTFIHFEDLPHAELPLQRHQTCPASLALFERSHGDRSPVTPRTPVDLATLDFWACLCSTALAAAVQPDLLRTDMCQTPTTACSPGASSSTSWPAPLKQTVEGLDEIIVSLNLQDHAAHIKDWCLTMGAAYLAEVAEAAEDLCNATALSIRERDRVLSWAAQVVTHAPDAHVVARKVSHLTGSQALMRTDGPSAKTKRTLWADLAELELSELQEGDAPPLPAIPVFTARESHVRWANPLITVIEFYVDEDEEEDDTAMENCTETQQSQIDSFVECCEIQNDSCVECRDAFEEEPVTPRTPTDLVTLDFWACLCSTAIAATMRPDLLESGTRSTPKFKFGNPSPTDSAISSTGTPLSREWPAEGEQTVKRSGEAIAVAAAPSVERKLPQQPTRILWADLAELETSELEAGEDVLMQKALPASLTARKRSVRWAYPLINVIEFRVDEYQEV